MTIERTQELEDRIFLEIAEGKSLVKVCEEKDMPSRETVRRWIRDDEDFCGNYVRAREEQADFYADEIIEIADTEPDTQKARLRIDARKWVASKLKSKSYGDKVTQEHSGPNGGAIEVKDTSAKERLFSRIDSLAARIGTPESD